MRHFVIALSGLSGLAPARELGLAGPLSAGDNLDLPPVTLPAGKPPEATPWVLTSAAYYDTARRQPGVSAGGKPGFPLEVDRRNRCIGALDEPLGPRQHRVRRGVRGANRRHRRQDRCLLSRDAPLDRRSPAAADHVQAMVGW